MSDPDALHRAALVARNKHQDALIRAHRLAALAREAYEHAALLEAEEYATRQATIYEHLTPKERSAALAVHVIAAEIIDAGEDG